MTEEEIVKRLVERFLTWRLPEDFNPDGGIYFQKTYNDGSGKFEPVGTNLFNYQQAKEMILYILKGLPEEKPVMVSVAESKGKDTYSIATNEGDRTFLNWIADRLVNVHGDDNRADFIITLRKFAAEFKPISKDKYTALAMQNAVLDKTLNDRFSRSVPIENELLSFALGGRGPITKEEARAWALRLGTPTVDWAGPTVVPKP